MYDPTQEILDACNFGPNSPVLPPPPSQPSQPRNYNNNINNNGSTAPSIRTNTLNGSGNSNTLNVGNNNFASVASSNSTRSTNSTRSSNSNSSNTSSSTTSTSGSSQRSRNSGSCILCPLPDAVWDTKEVNPIPQNPLTFPAPVTEPAYRSMQLPIVSGANGGGSGMNVSTKTVYLASLNSPRVAFMKVKQEEEIIPFGRIVYCAMFSYRTGVGYIEPPTPQEHRESLVAIKEIRRQSYFGLSGADSPLKDASVLSFVGNQQHVSGGRSGNTTFTRNNNNNSNGILQCTRIFQDENYWYMVCPMQQQRSFRRLAEVMTRAPPRPHDFNPRVAEGLIKPIFRDLVHAVRTAHQFGISPRNLDPSKIFLRPNNNNNVAAGLSLTPTMTAAGGVTPPPTTTTESPLLSCFCASILVPIYQDAVDHPQQQQQLRRHYISPGNTSSIANRRFLAPELYLNKRHDAFAADVWSLGVILFELLTGCKMFLHPTPMDPLYCFWIQHDGFRNTGIPPRIYDRILSGGAGTGTPTVPTAANNNNNNNPNSIRQRDQRVHEFLQTVQAVRDLSGDARDLLSSLLQEEPSRRLSTREILSHRWLLLR